MAINIDYVNGSFPNFRTIKSYTYNGNSFNFDYLFNFFDKQYNLNGSCYCNLKLFSKNNNTYEFLDEYNNDPSKNIELYRHLVVSYDNTRKCFCQCSNIELTNMLQKSIYHENKNKNEINDLKAENNNINLKYNQALNAKKIKEREIKQEKEEKLKLEKEIKQIKDEKLKLEKEIKLIKDEKLKLEKEYNGLNNEKNDLNNEKNKYKNGFNKLNEEIKKSNAEKTKLEKEGIELNNEIKKLREEKDKFEKEIIGFNNEIEELNDEKSRFEKEIIGLNSKINNLNNEKERIGNENVGLNNENKKLKEEISNFKKECQRLNNVVKKLNDEKTLFGNKLKELNGEIKSLNDEKNNIMELKQKNDTIINNMQKQHKEEIDVFNKQGNQYKEEINILRNEKQNLNKNILKLKKDYELNLENCKKDNNQLVNNINNLESNKKTLLLEKEGLQKQINNIYNEKLKIEKNNKELINNLEIIKNEVQKKDKHISEISQKNKEFEGIINELGKKIKVFENEKNTLKNDKKLLEDKIKSLSIDLKNKENKIKEDEIKVIGAIKQYDKLNNENKQFKEELGQIKILEKEKNTVEEKNKILEEKINTLEEKNNNIINDNETKEEYLSKGGEDYYDLIIDIDSINSIKNKGWEIKYNEARKENYDKIINEETIKIGVLGINNVGKTYILSKIARIKNLPKGFSVETKGISVKYGEKEKDEEKGICILDTEGHETPLLFEKESEEINSIDNNRKETDNMKYFNYDIKRAKINEELNRDKANTEEFIEECILSLSDMIILVIGKLTRVEQRMMTRIKNLAKNNNIKSIIVIHNLSHFTKKLEVERYIENYLMRSTTFYLKKNKVVGIEEYRDRFYYIEENLPSENNAHLKIYHYIMAKENSEAGNYYNDLTFKLIEQKYNSCDERKKIDIRTQIQNQFCESSNKMVNETITMSQFESLDTNRIKLKNNYIINANIKEDQNKSIQNFKLNDVYMDQEGNYFHMNSNSKIKYALYFYKEGIKKRDIKQYLLLRIELPGNITKLKVQATSSEEKINGIKIFAYKKKDEIPEASKKEFHEIFDKREYNEIRDVIPLNSDILLTDYGAIEETEIYKIKFNKDNEFEEEEQSDCEKEEVDLKDKDKDKDPKYEVVGCGVYAFKFGISQRSKIK